MLKNIVLYKHSYMYILSICTLYQKIVLSLGDHRKWCTRHALYPVFLKLELKSWSISSYGDTGFPTYKHTHDDSNIWTHPIQINEMRMLNDNYVICIIREVIITNQRIIRLFQYTNCTKFKSLKRESLHEHILKRFSTSTAGGKNRNNESNFATCIAFEI